MSIFCYKKIEAALCLGEKFKKRRAELGLLLTAISKATRIPLKYLEAIEQDNFSKLPAAKTYRLAYVREIARLLELNAGECVHQFVNEGGLNAIPVAHPRQSIKLTMFSSVSVFLRAALLSGAVALFSGYLIWQVKGILEPPRLIIYSPLEGHVLSQPSTTVEGETEKESRLTVNGQEIMVKENGKFEARINLSNGVNTIIIEATKKHGKTTSITRHLVVKQKIKGGEISLKP